ncbi:hypothetical protein [Photobacterium indicum]|uniref:Pentapeptide repeat-containing protein n=1 Tax=Photobacterium indicum TaxID=81447 RepID=A0A2T3LA05_9GAMM|nr:hypothetical protein [Photobacterium indicum]PSV48165.1 hypothetical protein C9J47_06375 [Photobacterium indicum]
MSEVSLLNSPNESLAKRVVLEGDDAIHLWLKGKDAWNQWVEDNPEADVSFEDVDFSKYAPRLQADHSSLAHSFRDFHFPNGDITFSGTHFGNTDVDFSNITFAKGKIDFSYANFGEGNVDFAYTQFGDGIATFIQTSFGDGNVYFTEAKFGNGIILFSNSKFGQGNKYFSEATFGNGRVTFRDVNFNSGDVCFTNATFGIGKVDFSNTKFGDGILSFINTEFGEGDVDFSKVEFGDGNVRFANSILDSGKADFSRTVFGNGDVIFSNVDFGEGDVDFSKTKYGYGDIDFTKARFGLGQTDFSEAKFSDGNIRFSGATIGSNSFLFEKNTIKGFAYFNDLLGLTSTKLISFRHSIFEKSLDFSVKGMGCIPDFTSTKTTNQVVLQELEYKLRREGSWFKEQATDIDDIARLRRIKEIAENNKDHAAALRFHADEMRAKRWHEMGTSASLLDMCFSGLSNYGQSILRPFSALCTLMLTMVLYVVGFAFPLSLNPKDYSQWLSNTLNIDFSTYLYGFELAVSSALPFISSSRNVNKTAGEALADTLPSYFGAISLVYGGLCFLFLFLIGLGLRNRFRI